MSQQISARVMLPPEKAATPISILVTHSEAIKLLERKAEEDHLKIIWDTYAVETEPDEFEEDRSFAQIGSPRPTRSYIVATVLAVTPEEIE